ncbi:MAG: DUF4886 domain-containing protein [Lentisphaeria bacterium]|nr:DUF4886 domain-containing protein [Lentisphaeria bacterium]
MIAKMLLTGLILSAAVVQLSAKEIKVLMIGNSFSVCVGRYLPQIVRTAPGGHKLELTSAYIGGCTFDKHSGNLKKAEKNPDFKPYGITCWFSDSSKKIKRFKGNVNELLKNNQYDVVTIQQGSPKSWDYQTYQPYADEVIAYIRKYQPKAEIVIQQTWAYRCDHPRLQPNPNAKWNFDQTGMYERIRDSYRKLAATYKLRMIPTGDAVQIYRKNTPVKFQPVEEKIEYPQLPSIAGDVVGNASWRKNGKTGQKYLSVDRIHLNSSGVYLQACLWFAFLYGEPVSRIAYVPGDMNAAENALLRKCAQEALDNCKQEK